MKPKTIALIAIAIFFYKSSFGQTDSTEYYANRLFLYKTEADFFNKNKIYRGQVEKIDGQRIIIYKTAGSKEKKKLDLKDSCANYFAYSWGGGEKWVHVSPTDYSYILFGGGTKDVYCVVGGTGCVYDADGYIKELFWQDWFEIYYYSKANNINGTKNIEDLLKLKPKLLEKYLAEKNESDKKAWKRNKIPTEMKYLKMFNAEQ